MKRMRMILFLFILSIILISISYPVMSANAKKVITENITLNVTVIIPITVVAQNAQICISLASSGDQTCQQLILDPTQTTLTPVDVDLTQEQPVITSGSANQTGTTTATPSDETSSSASNSNQSLAPGNSNITNPTSDHESKNNTHDQNANPTASDNHNAKDDKNTKDSKDQKQGEPTQEEPAQDHNTETDDTDQP
jgi:hypothetical protein